MRKVIAYLLLISSVFTSAVLTSCKEEIKTERHLMNGYESYSDLDKTLMNDQIQGKANLNDELEFVTEGSSSLKLELDYLSEYTDSSMFGTKITYVANRYDDVFTYLNDVKMIGVDIYTANDEEFEFFFGAYGEQDLCYFNDGQTLIANSWNYIRIPVKQYFFETTTLAKEYRFHINGVSLLEDKKADFYIDNLFFDINQSFDTPKIETQENEILSFATPTHLDAIMTKNAVDAYEFLPHMFVEQAPNVSIGDKKGGLKVTFARTHAWGDMYVDDSVEEGKDNNGYDIVVHKSLLGKIATAKSVSLVCYNPEATVHTVMLIGKKGKTEYVSKIDVAPDATEKVTLPLTAALDYLAIRIGSWNVVSDSHLYLRDLCYAN